MKETGVRNGAFGADKFGFKNLGAVNWNLLTAPLYEHALRNGEAELTAGGALSAETGVFTGRSPKDKFTVRDVIRKGWAGLGSNREIESALAVLEEFGHIIGTEDDAGPGRPTTRYRINPAIRKEVHP